jgi:formate C-acetyltransferase
VRQALLAEPDSICLDRATLATEADRLHANEPGPLRRAGIFHHVLGHMRLDVESNPYFAGNTSSRPRAWMLFPEFGVGVPPQASMENDRLASLFAVDPLPADVRDYWKAHGLSGHNGIGHLAVDLNRVVHLGLKDVIAELHRLGCDGETPPAVYRRAMLRSLQAVVTWAGRYADAAGRAAATAGDEELRRLHQRVACACRRVPLEPATNLMEALQSIVLIHLAIAIEGHGYSVSPGLLDRVLAPFAGEVEADVDGSVELIAAFLLKLTANSYWGSHSKTQAITIGGIDAAGRAQTNAVTWAMLEAFNRVRVRDPHLFVRWHGGSPGELMDRACGMLRTGISMPQLVNDEVTIDGLRRCGVSAEDAAGYCVIGCNELGVPGRLFASAVGPSINYGRLLRETMLGGTCGTVPELLAAAERRLAGDLARQQVAFDEGLRRRAERMPTPLTSALLDGCAAAGADMHICGGYRLGGLYERGLVNAANALAAMEHLAAQGVAPAQVAQAVADDFAGHESLRLRLREAPKWGCDGPQDAWLVALLEVRQRALSVAARGRVHVACHVVRSLHHTDGAACAATPDGRLAGEPFADSIGAELGTAAAGPLAMLNSVLKIDAARYYPGGYNLNLTLDPSAVSAEALRKLVETFFRRGGQELQINFFAGSAQLLAARAQPQSHRDLIVRVAGFNAVFVDLSGREQAELIGRAEESSRAAGRQQAARNPVPPAGQRATAR